jgi:hypothetical protein
MEKEYLMTPSFNIEPGDGTGSSLKDARIRNNNGICAITNCGKPCLDSCISGVLLFCKTHRKTLNEI